MSGYAHGSSTSIFLLTITTHSIKQHRKQASLTLKTRRYLSQKTKGKTPRLCCKNHQLGCLMLKATNVSALPSSIPLRICSVIVQKHIKVGKHSSTTAAPACTCMHAGLFNADSFQLNVDNCASTSITNCLTDFISPPKDSRKSILGIGGKTSALKIGTITEDDLGCAHTITLLNTYYVPNAPCCL